MSWLEVGEKIAKFAPLVGMALSSPLGAVTAVGEVVASILGVKANPDDVMGYLNANPDKAQDRISHEVGTNFDFQKLCASKIQEQNRHEESMASLAFSDTDSARKNSENINKSPIDNDIKMIIVVSQIILFLVCVSVMAYYHDNLNATLSGIMGTILGMLLKSLTTIIDFYWGSAFSVKDNK